MTEREQRRERLPPSAWEVLKNPWLPHNCICYQLAEEKYGNVKRPGFRRTQHTLLGDSVKQLIVAASLAAATCTLAQQAPQAKPMSSTLKVGDMAPDFTLPSTAGGKVTLSDFRGKKTVVLAFFPAAFTGG